MFYPIVSRDGKLFVPEMEWNEQSQSWNVSEELKEKDRVFYPIAPNGEERRWKWGHESFSQNTSEFTVRKDQTGNDAVFMKSRINDGTMPLSVWESKMYSSTEYGTNLLKHLFGVTEVFSFPKSLFAVEDCLRVIKGDSTILDYFAGSGTTAHAVIDLNRQDGGKRKYILIEMGDHFDTVLKPRIEKVVYSPDWKDGKPTAPARGISHCFKYLRLESYEDALNNIELEDKSAGLLEGMKDEYLLTYMLDLESRGSLIKTDDFRHPFDYTLKIAVDSSGASEKRKVDLVETFNYLIGLKVDQYVRAEEKGYAYVDGRNPKGERVLVFWRDTEKIPNAELNKELEKLGVNPANKEFDLVYVNGDHGVANVTLDGKDEVKVLKIKQLENEFLDKMFEER